MQNTIINNGARRTPCPFLLPIGRIQSTARRFKVGYTSDATVLFFVLSNMRIDSHREHTRVLPYPQWGCRGERAASPRKNSRHFKSVYHPADQYTIFYFFEKTGSEPMKIFISVDIEGVACVTHGDHCKLEGTEYEMARKWMTAETNAAIEGAYETGATEIVVADGHGHMRNILPDMLHEDVQLIRGSPRPLLQMVGIDDSFDAAFFVGHHAKANDGIGVLAHTFVGRIVYDLKLNGVPVCETTFNAAVAGHFGVPAVLAAGDDRLAEEIEAQLPWAERVITKWAISPTAARNLTPKASQKLIKAAAKRALGRINEMKTFTMDAPIRFEVSFKYPLQAFLPADIPGMERVDGRTLAYTGKDMLEISRIWRLMINSSLSGFAV
jgi:D-amino peptidase